MSRDDRARHSGEVGSGSSTPRLQPLRPEEWDDLLRLVLERSPGGVSHPLNVFTTLARNPELFRKWLGFGAALLDGRIAPRLRELVILRTAFRCDSRYEWVQHATMGTIAGVRPEELELLRLPLSSARWVDQERAVLEATDELHDTGTLSDSSWAALQEVFDEQALIEFVMLVGHYHLLAMALSALGVQPEEG